MPSIEDKEAEALLLVEPDGGSLPDALFSARVVVRDEGFLLASTRDLRDCGTCWPSLRRIVTLVVDSPNNVESDGGSLLAPPAR